ncbi:SRPBCC family protein [Actinomycetospora sp. OC33-EN08]|uniref:SRPBCC family protein n=1 Tax=Actinomycetospora aurantiaca TaxID=3129233 RepID=A0ABU8MNP4_9PSEU
MDARREAGAARREVATRQHEGEELVVARIDRTYPTDVEDLWDACTDPERIARWFLPVSGDLAQGGHYQLEGNASGTVTRCDRPRGFDATWEFNGQVSWIEVRFAPDGEGARLELTHVAPVIPGFWETYGPSAVGIGWDLGILGLALYLDGAPMAPADVETWSTSDEGREFVAACGHAWGTASEAIGIAPDDAAARAERTIAFYTGDEAG